MTFYITTPIYYVNDTPHIGHAYTTIIADVLHRYHLLFKDPSYFLTGTDEHGQKVQNAAKARGMDPQAHCDELVLRFQEAWKSLNIEPDIFMRTTAGFHKKVVQDCLQRLWDKGEIYTDTYEGWYSESEEIFYTEKDLVDGKSPTGKPVQKIAEKNYFFKMSKYQQRIIDHINANPEFVMPEGKRSEVLGFLRQPLGDLCISRPKTRLNWGIDIPFDAEYVTYVWFDALLNYVSAIGYDRGEQDLTARYEEFWPNAVHLIGKDILTTHTVYWPAMLMALELPLPRSIFAHGWWLTQGGSKMSKSEGPVVKPLDLKSEVGADQFRYFLVREVVLGNDAQFSRDLVINRNNSELANNLGNLASRAANLVEKFFEGKIPAASEKLAETVKLKEIALTAGPLVKEQVISLAPQAAIGVVIELLTATNQYLETLAPWKRIKVSPEETAECLYSALEVLRIAAILLKPVMPEKMAELLGRLGEAADSSWEAANTWGLLKAGTSITKGEPLFPRYDVA